MAVQELQALANQTGLSITVAYLLPGTSKWNLVEHRLFAFIAQNWRGKPSLTYEVYRKRFETASQLRATSIHAGKDP